MFEVLVATSIDAVGVSRLPAVLIAAGCRVTLVSGPGQAISSSRFVSHHILTQSGPAAVSQGLEAHLAAHPGKYDWVLIADEPLLCACLANPAALPQLRQAVPLLADIERTQRLISKIDFNVDAARAGVPVPGFQVLAGADELSLDDWDGTPVVIKAERSLSGSGVRVAHRRDDLAVVKAEFVEGRLLRQEHVAGRVGATAVLFDRGVPRCWFSYYLCRQWPTPYTSASAFEIFWHPDIEPMLHKLGAMSGFHGICGADWMYEATQDRLLVLEINPRPTPGLYLGKHAGVSFPEAIRAWLAGEERIQRPDPKARAFVRMFPQNLFRAIDDRDGLEFLRTWTDAPWTDPRLFASQMRRVVSHYLPRRLRDALKHWLVGSPAIGK